MENPEGKNYIKRKGAVVGFSFLLGLLLSAVKWGKYNFLFVLLIAAVFPPLGIILKKHRKEFVLIAVCVLGAIAYSSIYTKVVYNNLVKLDGKKVTVKGYIKDWDYLGSETCLLTVKGKINGIGGTIRFYAPYGDFDYYDKITAQVKAEKITDNVNFLAESYNRPNGIYIQGDNAVEYAVGKNINPVFREIAHYRDYCEGQIKVKCSKKSADFLCAMLCGDKSELSQSDKTLSYRCGIGHLLAVSGAHLLILVKFISLLLAKIKNKKVRFFIIMAVVWSFAVFSGLSVSVVRAAVMVTFIRSGFLFGRRTDTVNALGVCVLFLNLGCPYTAVSPSFLLTVCAAFIMEAVLPRCMKKSQDFFAGIGNTLITYQLIVFAMIPLNMILFGGVSVISPITNLIVAPICTLAMSFGFGFIILGCLSFLAPITIYLADKLMVLALFFIKYFANLPYIYISTNYKFLNVLMILAGIYWIFYVFYSKKSVSKIIILGIVLLITLELIYSILKLTGFHNRKKELLVLPAGRGSEYVLNTPESVVIFDYGAKGKGNGGVVRYLQKNSVENIDCVFLRDGEYDYSQLKNDVAVPMDFVFLDGYVSESDNIKDFDVGSYFSEKNFSVKQLKNGYLINVENKEILLSGKYFTINGEKYKALNADGAMILDFESEKVRRVDCGFN